MKDWIVVELENTAATDSEISLFQLPTNALNNVTYKQSFTPTFIMPTGAASGGTLFDMLGNTTSVWLGSSKTGVQIATDLSTATSSVWSYTGIFSNDGQQTTKYSKFQLDDGGLYNDFMTTTEFISGTTVEVSGLNGLTYNELTAELNNGYYELETVNVYANNINQANAQFKINDRAKSGKSYKDFHYPTLTPTTPQYVTATTLNFNPKSPKILKYNVLANQTVRLIFTYNTIMYKNDMPNKKEINESIAKVSLQKYIDNRLPIIKLVSA
jgi:hypothetical protein